MVETYVADRGVDLLLFSNNVRVYQIPYHLPPVLYIRERPRAREHDLAREEHEHHDGDARPSEDEARDDVALVGGVDVVALLKSLYVEDFALLDGELGVRDDVLNLEVYDREALAHAHTAEKTADVVGGQQGLRGRLASSDDELAGGEE